MRKKRGWRHPARHCSSGTGKPAAPSVAGESGTVFGLDFGDHAAADAVEAVKPYFARFMEALPDITSLAQVDEERLLKLWEGLGYYSRARTQ